MTDFIFLGFRITADGDCSQETKRRWLLRRKAMANLNSVLKSRDITLPAKVHTVKAMFFPEHCSGLPFPSLRDPPDPGIKPRSPALQADGLPSEPPEKPSLRLILANPAYTLQIR